MDFFIIRLLTVTIKAAALFCLTTVIKAFPGHNAHPLLSEAGSADFNLRQKD